LGYKVSLLDPAHKFFLALEVKEQRELALILLTLKKNPRPEGSRKLEPSLTEPVSGGHIWERPDWLVTYKLDEKAGTVDVGSIGRRP
jgi:hypothetical protein